MTLPAQAQAALDSFASCTSWEQRARLLMQWGQRLPELDERDKNEANRVHGCESQVWLVGKFKDGHWHFDEAPQDLSTLHYVAGGQFYATGASVKV